jgi:hypothetical protein
LLSPSPSLALASRPIDRIISSCIANCSARPFFSESHIGSQSFHPPVPYASASSRVVAAVASIVAVIITIARRVDRSSRASSSSRATARVVVVVVARRAFARVARRALARVVVGRVVVVGHVIIGIVAMCRATIRFARDRERRARDRDVIAIFTPHAIDRGRVDARPRARRVGGDRRVAAVDVALEKKISTTRELKRGAVDRATPARATRRIHVHVSSRRARTDGWMDGCPGDRDGRSRRGAMSRCAVCLETCAGKCVVRARATNRTTRRDATNDADDEQTKARFETNV